MRETIRGVATEQGLVASLAPKPWPDEAGNGCHVHFSLWDGRRTTASTTPDARLSAEGRGLLRRACSSTCPGLCGLTAPSFNSYRRIAPQTWSGAYRCWGYDNREAPRARAVGRSAALEEASTNVELKAADASCNPYLALGGLIAAGLDGLERGLDAAGAGRRRSGDAERPGARANAASSGSRRRRRRRSTRSGPTRY